MSSHFFGRRARGPVGPQRGAMAPSGAEAPPLAPTPGPLGMPGRCPALVWPWPLWWDWAPAPAAWYAYAPAAAAAVTPCCLTAPSVQAWIADLWADRETGPSPPAPARV